MVAKNAGMPATPADLINVDEVIGKYYDVVPDPNVPEQRVSFGTSGHRGSSLKTSFNEAHIVAITQAIAEYRKKAGVTGPLYIGRDTHALSEPAWKTAIEVLVANGVTVRIDSRDDFTPTPVVSQAILTHNRAADGTQRFTGEGLADGIVVTPSHNPPTDGGFKYDPVTGGPAPAETTNAIAARANELLGDFKSIKPFMSGNPYTFDAAGKYVIGFQFVSVHKSEFCVNDRPVDPEGTNPFGYIEVTITPDEAVNNGGKWRIQGEEAWRESGTYAAVPGGKEYTVEFLEAAGYTTPAVQKKTPAAGKVEKVTGTYVVKSE